MANSSSALVVSEFLRVSRNKITFAEGIDYNFRLEEPGQFGFISPQEVQVVSLIHESVDMGTIEVLSIGKFVADIAAITTDVNTPECDTGYIAQVASELTFRLAGVGSFGGLE